MTDPAAKGERFLAVSGDFISIPEVGNVLRDRMGAQARKVPTRELPNWLVRVASLRDPAAHGEQNFESYLLRTSAYLCARLSRPKDSIPAQLFEGVAQMAQE
jgi:hypothetical protein